MNPEDVIELKDSTKRTMEKQVNIKFAFNEYFSVVKKYVSNFFPMAKLPINEKSIATKTKNPKAGISSNSTPESNENSLNKKFFNWVMSSNLKIAQPIMTTKKVNIVAIILPDF